MGTSTGAGLPEPSCAPRFPLHRGQVRYCGVALCPQALLCHPQNLCPSQRPLSPPWGCHPNTHPGFPGTLPSSVSEEMLPQINTRRFWDPPMTKGAPYPIWSPIVPYFCNTGWMTAALGVMGVATSPSSNPAPIPDLL